jgi:hypothetical protein
MKSNVQFCFSVHVDKYSKFQLNALVLLLKHKNYSFVLMSLNFLTPTFFFLFNLVYCMLHCISNTTCLNTIFTVSFTYNDIISTFH